MSRYIVHAYLTISVVKEFEATGIADARVKAEGIGPPSLCHHCSSAGKGDDETWVLNGFDDFDPESIQSVESA